MMRYMIYVVYLALAGIGIWWLWGLMDDKVDEAKKPEPEKEKPDDGPV